jgi:hypothetical protein
VDGGALEDAVGVVAADRHVPLAVVADEHRFRLARSHLGVGIDDSPVVSDKPAGHPPEDGNLVRSRYPEPGELDEVGVQCDLVPAGVAYEVDLSGNDPQWLGFVVEGEGGHWHPGNSDGH